VVIRRGLKTWTTRPVPNVEPDKPALDGRNQGGADFSTFWGSLPANAHEAPPTRYEEIQETQKPHFFLLCVPSTLEKSGLAFFDWRAGGTNDQTHSNLMLDDDEKTDFGTMCLNLRVCGPGRRSHESELVKQPANWHGDSRPKR